jgi:hypothetical protein
MLIDVNEQSQNVWPSMHLSRDPSSNPKAAICLRDEKQKYRMTSIAHLHQAYSTFRRLASINSILDSRLLLAKLRKLLRHQIRRENKCERG